MTFDERAKEVLDIVMSSDAVWKALETPNDVIVLAEHDGRVRVAPLDDFRSYYRQHSDGPLIEQIEEGRAMNECVAVPVLILGEDEGRLFWVAETSSVYAE